MGNVSVEWLAAISTGREYSIDEKKKGYAVPVTPWLHPPVGKRLRSLIIKLGTVREIAAALGAETACPKLRAVTPC